MTDAPLAQLAISGPAAPPRVNGELVFAAPWESRMFGVTLALQESGAFAWPEFQARLIAAVARWEREHPGGEGYRYYECWSAALESLLDERDILPAASIDERAAELAAQPAGHDHAGHDHAGHDDHDG